jgi:hypothetical protein
MTPEAYNKIKWRGLNNLQSALSTAKLDDHHYGYSSAHYNKFETLSDLLQISLLVLDNVDKIPYSGGAETYKEMRILAEKLQDTARELGELSYNLNDKAEHWAESALRPIS